jgi:hypothetical protein
MQLDREVGETVSKPTSAGCRYEDASTVRGRRASAGIEIASTHRAAKANTTGKRENLEDALRGDIALSSLAHYRHEQLVSIIAASLPAAALAVPVPTATLQRVVPAAQMQR